MVQPVSDFLDTLPSHKLRSALLQAAVPGTFGKVSIALCLTPEAIELFDVVVRQKFSCQAKPLTVQPREDPRREYAIARALHSIGERMRRRACLISCDFHFADGELVKYYVEHTR